MRFRFLTLERHRMLYEIQLLPSHFQRGNKLWHFAKKIKAFLFWFCPWSHAWLAGHDAYTSYTVTHPRGYRTVWQLINAAVVESCCGSLSPSQLAEDFDIALVRFSSIAIHRQLHASILHSTPPRSLCSQIALDMNSKSILIYWRAFRGPLFESYFDVCPRAHLFTWKLFTP